MEPQVRPTFEELSPSNLANNIQGRLPRKTIKNNVDEEDDEDEYLKKEEHRSSPVIKKGKD